MADEPEEAAGTAEPSPREEAGSRRPSRMRRGGILVSMLTAASAGLVHLVGGPEAAIVGTGIAAAGGSGLAVYHLPKIRKHFNENRREKQPKAPRAPRPGRERRAGAGRSAAGRSVPRGARSRSGPGAPGGGTRRGGSPFRPGTGRASGSRASGPLSGRRATTGRATGRPGTARGAGTARGGGTGRRARTGPRHPGTGHRPLFRRHGGTAGRGTSGGTRGRTGMFRRHGGTAGRGTSGGTRGRTGMFRRGGAARGRTGGGRAGSGSSAARSSRLGTRFRPWRRGAAAATAGRRGRAHPFARGSRPGSRGGSYRRPPSASRRARKRGPAGNRRRGTNYKGRPNPKAGRYGRRTARKGPPPGLTARVRKVRPWWAKVRRIFGRPPAPATASGKTAAAPKRDAATFPKLRAAGRLWRRHRTRTVRAAKRHGRRVKKAVRWTGRKTKATRSLTGRIRSSLLSWGKKDKPGPGPSVKYTFRSPPPADKHMPEPDAASTGRFPGFGEKVRTPPPPSRRRGAFNMAGFPLQQVTEQLEDLFTHYDPENIDELTGVFGLTDLFETLSKGIKTISSKFGEDLPVKPEVADGFSEAGSAVAGLEDLFRDLNERFEVLHKDELERIRNPRPKERIWDTTANQ